MMKKLAVMLSMSLLLGAVATGCKKDTENKAEETAPAAITPEPTEPMEAAKPILQEPTAPATEEPKEEPDQAAAPAAGDEAAAGDEGAGVHEGHEGEEATGHDDEEAVE